MARKKDDFERCPKCGEVLTLKEKVDGVCCLCKRNEADRNEAQWKREGSADVEN